MHQGGVVLVIALMNMHDKVTLFCVTVVAC
jgi:hypothetical protein